MNKCDINWRMRIGHYIRKLGRWISGPYWVCTHCGWIKFKEEEVLCWECGLGEMIYQGDLENELCMGYVLSRVFSRFSR